MRDGLRRVLLVGWVLVALAWTAAAAWYILRGGSHAEMPNRAQVAGTLWGLAVPFPPLGRVSEGVSAG